MKVTTLIFSAFMLFCCPFQAGAFKTLAGIELGTAMESYWDLLHQDTATELPDVLFMKEVKLKPGAIPGVRGGSLSYSVCGDRKLVARMKLKFVDRDEQLFRDLDRLYRERWGRPDRWAGDHFSTIQAWLWLLGDQNEMVEVILMHSKLDDMRPGVSIKITHLTLWEEERACWERQLDRESYPLDAEAMQIRNLEDFVPH